MSAKTTLKEHLDKFRGKKCVDYTNAESESETKTNALRYVSKVHVTLYHSKESKSFTRSGQESITIKQAQASAAQELLENTDVAFFCCWENWETSPQTDEESPVRSTSTSTIHAENSSSFFRIEPPLVESSLVSSSPRTPNESKLDAILYQTTPCAPFVCTLTASGTDSSMKLVIRGEPCFSKADAESSAYNKFLKACFTRSFVNPASVASRDVPQPLLVTSNASANHASDDGTALTRRQARDNTSISTVSSPTSAFAAPARPPTPPLPSLRDNIISSASTTLPNYLFAIDDLLSVDQKCRLEMWEPVTNLSKEKSRDVLLIMHTLFPNPTLTEEVWTLMDKRYTLSVGEIADLCEKEAANRTFLVRYILLLHRNLTYREKQRNTKADDQHSWSLPLACALCHGGRILTEVVGGHAIDLLSILYHGAPCKELGMIKRRFSSHKLSFEKGGFYKERKAWHYAETYGFNISFGGLGNHYDRDKKIIGPEGVGIERKKDAKKWKDLKKHPQQGHVLIKWHESVTGSHLPTSALLIGIENVDYSFKHGYFGAGHSMFGLSGSKSVTNGDKLSCVFEKQNSALDSKSATPSKLGGLRVSYPGGKLPAFQSYCAKFLALSVEEQMIVMLAILTNELDNNIEQEVLGVKYAAYL